MTVNSITFPGFEQFDENDGLGGPSKYSLNRLPLRNYFTSEEHAKSAALFERLVVLQRELIKLHRIVELMEQRYLVTREPEDRQELKHYQGRMELTACEIGAIGTSLQEMVNAARLRSINIDIERLVNA